MQYDEVTGAGSMQYDKVTGAGSMQYAQYVEMCVQNVAGKNRNEEINCKICKLVIG
jgi:hypothetical protein